MSSTTPPPPATRRKRRMKRKMAAIAAGLVSISGVAGASVLIQNFMAAEFNAGPPPCLIKEAGTDTDFDAFTFDATGTTMVDGVAVTQEVVTIDGLTGDRVYAQEVYRIANNCAYDLDVTLVNRAQAGNWTDRYMEVWLGETETPTSYPGLVNGEYNTTKLVFGPVGTAGLTVTETGTVTVAAGDFIPVGMIVTTAAAADDTNAGEATWTVQAETTPAP